MNELDYKMNLVIDNYPIPLLRPFLYPLKNTIVYPSLEHKNLLYKMIQSDKTLNSGFMNDIYYKGTVLEKMELLKTLKPNTPTYNKLYVDILNVGEYNIKST
jgi:hypothetical protein